MNLQDLVKEIVAQTVAEKKLTAAEKKKKEDIVMAMKKDFKGPKSAMYAIATDKAKKLAEDEAVFSSQVQQLLSPEQIQGIKDLIPGVIVDADEMPFSGWNIVLYMNDGSSIDSESISNLSQIGLTNVSRFDDDGKSYYYVKSKDIAEGNIEEGGSDGDYEDTIDRREKAEKLYDAGKALFNQGKTKEAEAIRQQALKASYGLGWGDTELPPYTSKTNEVYKIDVDDEGNIIRTDLSKKKEMDQLQSTADDTSKMPADRDAARNKMYAAKAEKSLNENDAKYYAIFDLNSDPIYYTTGKSAQEMLSLLNGYIKAKAKTNPAYGFSYDMEDLQDDYYNGKVLATVISDDFALVTKNSLYFNKNLSNFPEAIEYKGVPTQELDEVTKRKMQYYAGIIK